MYYLVTARTTGLHLNELKNEIKDDTEVTPGF